MKSETVLEDDGSGGLRETTYDSRGRLVLVRYMRWKSLSDYAEWLVANADRLPGWEGLAEEDRERFRRFASDFAKWTGDRQVA